MKIISGLQRAASKVWATEATATKLQKKAAAKAKRKLKAEDNAASKIMAEADAKRKAPKQILCSICLLTYYKSIKPNRAVRVLKSLYTEYTLLQQAAHRCHRLLDSRNFPSL